MFKMAQTNLKYLVVAVIIGILLFTSLQKEKEYTGLISVNLYDNSGNLMAIVNGQAGVSEMGYTLNVVNTGDQALDMTVTLTGSATAYNTFSSVPGCSAVTNGMQCLFSLSTGQTKVLTGARIDANAIAPSTLTLDALAQGSFNYFGETQIIQQGDSSTVVIQSESVVIRGCTDSSAANYDPQATEDDGSCRYVFKISDLTNIQQSLQTPFTKYSFFYFQVMSTDSTSRFGSLGIVSSICAPGFPPSCTLTYGYIDEPALFSSEGVSIVISSSANTAYSPDAYNARFIDGDYFILTYGTPSSNKNVYIPDTINPSQVDSAIFYVASDGSTYYDPQLTQLAKAAS